MNRSGLILVAFRTTNQKKICDSYTCKLYRVTLPLGHNYIQERSWAPRGLEYAVFRDDTTQRQLSTSIYCISMECGVTFVLRRWILLLIIFGNSLSDRGNAERCVMHTLQAIKQVARRGHSTASLLWPESNQALFLIVSSLISLLLKSSYKGNEKQWSMRVSALLIKGCRSVRRHKKNLFLVASEVF
jgi:hypothetical protein